LVQVCHLLFLFLLSLSLYCGELPESLVLSDDGTNDFVESSASHGVSELQRVHENPAGTATSFSVEEPPEEPPSLIPFGAPPRLRLISRPNLLRLLSIQRK
jgi:hypothetical protein